jgi:hypothetical protein
MRQRWYFITIYFLYSVILLNLICVYIDFKEDRTTYYCVVLLAAFGRVFPLGPKMIGALETTLGRYLLRLINVQG